MLDVYDNLTTLMLWGGVLIVLCVCSSKVSSRFSMPGLLMFLLLGMGMHLLAVNFHAADGVVGALPWRHANAIGTIALAFILFSGGFDSSVDDIRKVFCTGTLLSTVGVLLTTLCLGGVAFGVACFCGRRDLWAECFLFGAIISSTDASAVFSILRSKRISLRGNLRPLLEYESGSNDPMATFLTLFFLDFCAARSGGDVNGLREFLFVVPEFLYKMGMGVLVGFVIAKIGAWLFNHLHLDYDGLYYVFGIAVVLLTYSVADCCHANGFMATYAGGVFMGSRRFVFRNSFSRFADALAWLMQVVLFTILGFMANPRVILQYWWLGVIMGSVLMLLVRPLAVFLCMIGSGFSWKGKTLVSWVGLRGGAPIMLATFPMLIASTNAVAMEQTAIGETNIFELIFNLVFCMVLLSVVIQSFTIMPLARILGLDSPLKMTPTAPISFDQVSFHGKKEGMQTEGGHSDDLSYNEPVSYAIPEDSGLAGQRIKELRLPKDIFIVMISRGGEWLVPRGDTTLNAGDTLTVLATPENHRLAAKFFQRESRSSAEA